MALGVYEIILVHVSVRESAKRTEYSRLSWSSMTRFFFISARRHMQFSSNGTTNRHPIPPPHGTVMGVFCERIAARCRNCTAFTNTWGETILLDASCFAEFGTECVGFNAESDVYGKYPGISCQSQGGEGLINCVRASLGDLIHRGLNMSLYIINGVGLDLNMYTCTLYRQEQYRSCKFVLRIQYHQMQIVCFISRQLLLDRNRMIKLDWLDNVWLIVCFNIFIQ